MLNKRNRQIRKKARQEIKQKKREEARAASPSRAGTFGETKFRKKPVAYTKASRHDLFNNGPFGEADYLKKQLRKDFKDPKITVSSKDGYTYTTRIKGKTYKVQQVNNSTASAANRKNQISETRTKGRVGKKGSNPFYYRTVKGKKQRVRKGKR